MKNFTSIVIINWNGAQYLARAIDTIFRFKNKTPFEVIIVDNGSTDQSIEYMKNIEKNKPDVMCIYNKENLGFPKANNIGIRAATGKYILLLNNDIEIRGHNWLDKMVNFLMSTPSAGVVGAKGGLLTENLEFAGTKPESYQGAVDYVEGWCFLFKKSLGDKIKLCRKEKWNMRNEYLCEDMFIFAEDSEFCQRSKMLGHECFQIANIPIHHFGNSTVKTQTKENPNASYDFREVSVESTNTLKTLIPKKCLLNSKNKKILVMRGNARGDVLNTTPALRALRHKNPDAFIGYVCFYPSLDVINLNHDIDYVFPILEQTNHGFHPYLLNIKWDEAYYLGDHMFPSMQTIITHVKAQNTSVFSGHELMESQHVSIRKKRGVVKKPYSRIFAEILQVDLLDPTLVLNITSKTEKEAKNILQKLDPKRKTIGICVDSHWMTRTYPFAMREELLNLLLKRYNVVLLGISYFKTRIVQNNNFINLLQRTSFELLSAIIKNIDMLITIDTATIHIGLAFHKPIVSLWSITEPYHVMSYQPKRHIALSSDLSCSPCYLEDCPNKKNGYACYKQLFPERVLDAVNYLENSIGF